MSQEERLRFIIDSTRKTYKEIAYDLGYSRPQSISDNLKPGKATEKFIVALCKTYGFNLDWVKYGTGERYQRGLSGFEAFSNLKEDTEFNSRLLKFLLLHKNDPDYKSDIYEYIDELKIKVRKDKKLIESISKEDNTLISSDGKILKIYEDYLETKQLSEFVRIIDIGNLQNIALLPLVQRNHYENYIEEYLSDEYLKSLPSFAYNVFDVSFFLTSNTFYRAFEADKQIFISKSNLTIDVSDIVVGFKLHISVEDDRYLTLLNGNALVLVLEESIEIVALLSYSKKKKQFKFLHSDQRQSDIHVSQILQLFMIVDVSKRMK